MSLGGQYADELRTVENAVGIVQLRLADDEWSRATGEKMLRGASTHQLLAHIAKTAMSLYAALEADEETK
jgi:hypothetical protein